MTVLLNDTFSIQSFLSLSTSFSWGCLWSFTVSHNSWIFNSEAGGWVAQGNYLLHCKENTKVIFLFFFSKWHFWKITWKKWWIVLLICCSIWMTGNLGVAGWCSVLLGDFITKAHHQGTEHFGDGVSWILELRCRKAKKEGEGSAPK